MPRKRPYIPPAQRRQARLEHIARKTRANIMRARLEAITVQVAHKLKKANYENISTQNQVEDNSEP